MFTEDQNKKGEHTAHWHQTCCHCHRLCRVSLRLETAEDRVHMIVLDPGISLFQRTNMGSRQEAHYENMENNMLRPVRMDKFHDMKNLFSQIQSPELKVIDDETLIRLTTYQSKSK